MVEYGREGAKAGSAALGLAHRLSELGRELREAEVHSGLRVNAKCLELRVFRPCIFLILDRVVQKAGVLEGDSESRPVFRQASLDAPREGLHDLRIDLRHEAKVEEDEPPIVAEHNVALVRISVDVTGEDERGSARLDRHARHS